MSEVMQVADDRIAVAVASTAEGQALADRLRQLPACIEAVGGIAVVEAQFDLATTGAERFAAAVAAEYVAERECKTLQKPAHEIPVAYGGPDGPDLDAVCNALGMDAREFIRRHTARTCAVAMLGFTPGFAYLDGMDGTLAVPRRDMPRQFVPAGSVGIAGARTGIYALGGPGGWQIIGRTAARLFDPDAESPFRLRPGDRVRFVEAAG